MKQNLLVKYLLSRGRSSSASTKVVDKANRVELDWNRGPATLFEETNEKRGACSFRSYRDESNLECSMSLAELTGPLPNRVQIAWLLQLREELLDLIKLVDDTGLSLCHGHSTIRPTGLSWYAASVKCFKCCGALLKR